MLNKKADAALPLYLGPTLAALVIVLFIFSIIFFVVGIKQNPDLVIKPAAYQDSHNIITILKIQKNNSTIAELISLAAEDKNYKNELSSELVAILQKLPKQKPQEDLAKSRFAVPSEVKGSLQSSEWILEIFIENELFMKVGEKPFGSSEYLGQSVIIPLENKKLAEIKLFLACTLCSEGEINAIA